MATVKSMPATNGKHNNTGKSDFLSTAVAEVTKQGATPPPAQEQPAANPPKLPDITPEERQLPPTTTAIPIGDRFYQLDRLLSMRDKYEKIKDCLDKLNKWKLAADGRGDNVTLKDAAGLTFTTYNASAVKMFVDLLKKDLTDQLQELDAKITF